MKTDITRRFASFPSLKCRVEVVRLTVLERLLGLELDIELVVPPVDGLLLSVGITSFFSRGIFSLEVVSLRTCSVADITDLGLLGVLCSF
jgi:hypothetical protein